MEIKKLLLEMRATVIANSPSKEAQDGLMKYVTDVKLKSNIEIKFVCCQVLLPLYATDGIPGFVSRLSEKYNMNLGEEVFGAIVGQITRICELLLDINS